VTGLTSSSKWIASTRACSRRRKRNPPERGEGPTAQASRKVPAETGPFTAVKILSATPKFPLRPGGRVPPRKRVRPHENVPSAAVLAAVLPAPPSEPALRHETSRASGTRRGPDQGLRARWCALARPRPGQVPDAEPAGRWKRMAVFSPEDALPDNGRERRLRGAGASPARSDRAVERDPVQDRRRRQPGCGLTSCAAEGAGCPEAGPPRRRPPVIDRAGWHAMRRSARAPYYAERCTCIATTRRARTRTRGRKSASIVRAIELYHVTGNGMEHESGYNFLVDKYGRSSKAATGA